MNKAEHATAAKSERTAAAEFWKAARAIQSAAIATANPEVRAVAGRMANMAADQARAAAGRAEGRAELAGEQF